ncbi:response regulator [Bifidobacterium indicum]|nr:response regulator [Bifidobacterium indicum]
MKVASDIADRDDSPKGRTVVVAEDEALIRLDTVEALEDAGYDVVGQAASGQEAIDLTRQLRPDVVVMDVKMPGTDGITAATEIAEENLAPVVMLTAFSQQNLVEKAADAGAMAYVVKPFAPEKLLPALEVAISRFDQINTLKDEVTDMKARFEARKRVDRAKGLLMENMGLTESEAFRWIQKTSMDRRLTMQEVADAVISQVQGSDN